MQNLEHPITFLTQKMLGSTHGVVTIISHRCSPLSVDTVDLLTNNHVAVQKEPQRNSDRPGTSDSSDPLPFIARDNQRRLLNKTTNHLFLLIIIIFFAFLFPNARHIRGSLYATSISNYYNEKNL